MVTNPLGRKLLIAIQRNPCQPSKCIKYEGRGSGLSETVLFDTQPYTWKIACRLTAISNIEAYTIENTKVKSGNATARLQAFKIIMYVQAVFRF